MKCKFWHEFDPVLGRGECTGWGKHQIEATALEMVATGEAPTLEAALSRTKPWKYPITLFTDPECGRFVLKPPP